MTRTYNLNSSQTLDTINQLFKSGIKNMSVIIRHSERHFTDVSRTEPFMGLTENGKKYAYDFGMALTSIPKPLLVSSFFGRCIETAYLIDKGFTNKHSQPLDHTQLEPLLSPFYINNPDKAIPILLKIGDQAFLRNWFDGSIDESIMENPKKTVDILCELMINQIKNQVKNQKDKGLTICISHDWNIYPVKELKLGMKLEESDDVGYLDALIFFKKDNQYYITSYQTNPMLLK